MRLKIIFKKPDELIPFAYQHYIQGAIYSSLNADTANFLHDKGHWTQNKNYKMFTYSQLLGHYAVIKGKLKFDTRVSLYITSLYANVLNQLYVSFSEKGYMRLGNVILYVDHVEAIKEKDVNLELSSYFIKSLSPVLVYSTDEKKYTTYYDSHSQLFEDTIKNNLFHKFESLYDRMPEHEIFKITEVIKDKSGIYKYKNNTFKGHNVLLKIEATHDLLLIALHTGIGSKNSDGFGMIELVEDKS